MYIIRLKKFGWINSQNIRNQREKVENLIGEYREIEAEQKKNREKVEERQQRNIEMRERQKEKEYKNYEWTGELREKVDIFLC